MGILLARYLSLAVSLIGFYFLSFLDLFLAKK